MYVSFIPVMCYYNGHIVRTDNDVKYDGNKASIVPLKIPVDCTFEQLGDIIFASTPIDKRKFNLVLKCKYPLKCGNRFQPFTIWNDRSVHLMLNMVNTTVIEEIELFVEVVRIHREEDRSIGVAVIEHLPEIDHGCGPSSGPVLDTGAYGDDDDACVYEEGNDESGEDDDEYDDYLHDQAGGHVSSFQTTNQVLENERGLFVSAHALHCDVSNIVNDDEGPVESAPIQYHLPPTPCFEHVENIDIATSSGWTPWVQQTTSYACGEFIKGQVFNSKSELQEAAKIYSIRAHQEFVVVASSKKLLVLRCKKAEECQCEWKLRAMVVKETGLFVINKYEGPHTCVNPCLNRDHHQLDSKLVATHIQAIIKAQFTLSPAAIQASVMEKWGYEISYKKALDGKHKAFRHLFGDFSQSYTDLPRLFLAIEQANPGCVVIWKTTSHSQPNKETFQRVLWAFKASIEGFANCRPVLSIDGTHLYGKYKGTLLIAMGCDGNNQLFPLAFAITEGENIDS